MPVARLAPAHASAARIREGRARAGDAGCPARAGACQRSGGSDADDELPEFAVHSVSMMMLVAAGFAANALCGAHVRALI